ncbi:MAG TPA: hypothetical protein PLZ51_08145, partial [Aggregatilineales bacterium]|nr:hypothetical protein [Aggregatilineales bacterium]
TLHQWIHDEDIYRRCDDLIELLQEWGLTYHSQVAACLLPILQQNLNDTMMNTQFSERAIHLCRVAQSILAPNKSKSATPRAIRAEHLRKCYKLAYTDSEAL